jgi:hypothetical protein
MLHLKNCSVTEVLLEQLQRLQPRNRMYSLNFFLGAASSKTNTKVLMVVLMQTSSYSGTCAADDPKPIRFGFPYKTDFSEDD